MPDKKTLIRWLLFTAYFTAVFMVFLLLLFPFDQARTKLESEVRLRTPVELSIARISPRFFNRFVLSDVVVSDKSGKVLFESPSARTSFSLLGLLRGLLILEVNAPAYGGELLVKAQQGQGRRSFAIDATGMDLGSYPLFKTLGLKLSGTFGGNFAMTNDAGKGRFWLKGLASRELKIKGFPVPDLDFEQAWLEGEIKGDRLIIKKLEFEGKELKVRCQGELVMRERGALNLTIKLKPSERLAQEQSGILSLLKNKDVDGFYQFSIGGTLSEPIPRL